MTPTNLTSATNTASFNTSTSETNQPLNQSSALRNDKLIKKVAPKQYLCLYDLCGKVFLKESKIIEHIRTHTGEKPFSCPHTGCGQDFSKKGNLTRHIRTHTGERPFSCTHTGCGQTFSDQSNFNKHIRTHTGKIPFKSSQNNNVISSTDITSLKRKAVDQQIDSMLSEKIQKISVDESNLSSETKNPDTETTNNQLMDAASTSDAINLEITIKQEVPFLPVLTNTVDNSRPFLQHPTDANSKLLPEVFTNSNTTITNIFPLLKNYSKASRSSITRKVKQNIINYLNLSVTEQVKITNTLVKEMIPLDDYQYRGDSLFANNDIEKFTVIGVYSGVWLTSEDEIARENARVGKINVDNYAWNTRHGVISGFGGYGNSMMKINSATSKNNPPIGRNNIIAIELEIIPEANKSVDLMVYIAKTKIKKGNELLIDYGENYWNKDTDDYAETPLPEQESEQESTTKEHTAIINNEPNN